MTLAPLTLALTLAAPALAPPPATPRRPVADTYQGVSVAEDHRWLENAGDPEVQAWQAAQDARARGWLSALDAAGGIRARVRELGHGIGSALDERIAETADLYAFFLHELGVPWKLPAAPRGR